MYCNSVHITAGKRERAGTGSERIGQDKENKRDVTEIGLGRTGKEREKDRERRGKDKEMTGKSLPCVNKYTVPTYTVCKGGGVWGSGPQRDKHLQQSPFTDSFFR
jgi:hypothetical protein